MAAGVAGRTVRRGHRVAGWAAGGRTAQAGRSAVRGRHTPRLGGGRALPGRQLAAGQRHRGHRPGRPVPRGRPARWLARGRRARRPHPRPRGPRRGAPRVPGGAGRRPPRGGRLRPRPRDAPRGVRHGSCRCEHRPPAAARDLGPDRSRAGGHRRRRRGARPRPAVRNGAPPTSAPSPDDLLGPVSSHRATTGPGGRRPPGPAPGRHPAGSRREPARGRGQGSFVSPTGAGSASGGTRRCGARRGPGRRRSRRPGTTWPAGSARRPRSPAR